MCRMSRLVAILLTVCILATVIRITNAGQDYIRWGRTTCATNTSNAIVIYKGYAVGPHYNHVGSGGNFLCLADNPQWLNHVSGHNGYIYGVEYEIFNDNNNVFSYANNGGNAIRDQPAPCVSCYALDRSAMVMIPGRTECPTGWYKEYMGYLVSEEDYPGRQRSSYICWDEAPETASGGYNQDQGIIYPVLVGCGSLPCSTYPNGWNVACVVCTR